VKPGTDATPWTCETRKEQANGTRVRSRAGIAKLPARRDRRYHPGGRSGSY
jgi:hypothetical protein